jgi:hypothetical protein
MNGYGTITKVLEKIKTAATPPRFTQDFLATKLGLPGGTPRPVIPFLKRAGFLGGDGIPTDLYKRFRNPTESRRAGAEALKTAYQRLYEMNEYAHELGDDKLKGLIVQATGMDAGSPAVRAMIGSFKALRDFASFESEPESETESAGEPAEPTESTRQEARATPARIGLSYTINLNLPSTSDIAVFDAIFKSLRANLLKG